MALSIFLSDKVQRDTIVRLWNLWRFSTEYIDANGDTALSNALKQLTICLLVHFFQSKQKKKLFDFIPGNVFNFKNTFSFFFILLTTPSFWPWSNFSIFHRFLSKVKTSIDTWLHGLHYFVAISSTYSFITLYYTYCSSHKLVDHFVCDFSLPVLNLSFIFVSLISFKLLWIISL